MAAGALSKSALQLHCSCWYLDTIMIITLSDAWSESIVACTLLWPSCRQHHSASCWKPKMTVSLLIYNNGHTECHVSLPEPVALLPCLQMQWQVWPGARWLVLWIDLTAAQMASSLIPCFMSHWFHTHCNKPGKKIWLVKIQSSETQSSIQGVSILFAELQLKHSHQWSFFQN